MVGSGSGEWVVTIVRVARGAGGGVLSLQAAARGSSRSRARARARMASTLEQAVRRLAHDEAVAGRPDHAGHPGRGGTAVQLPEPDPVPVLQDVVSSCRVGDARAHRPLVAVAVDRGD